MDTYGAHRVLGVYIFQYQFMYYFEQIMPIPVGVVTVLVNKFLTVYILRGF